MIYQNDIANLESDIRDKIGQKIIVKGSLGRSKSFEKEATIEKAYTNIFIVKYEENKRTVEVDVFDGEGYSPLIPPLVKTPKKIKAMV